MSPQYRQAVSDMTARELNKEAGSTAQPIPPMSSNNTNVNNVDQNDDKGPLKDGAVADTTKPNNAKETPSTAAASEAPNKERDEILKGLTTSFNSTVDCSTYK